MKYVLCFFLIFNLSFLNTWASDVSEAILQYQADRGALLRKYTLIASDEYYDRMEKLHADWLEELERFDFQNLDQQGRVDYHLFKNYLEKENYQLALSRQDFVKVKHLADFASPILPFIFSRRRGDKPDAQHVASTMHEVAKALTLYREELERKNDPLESWQLSETAASMVKNYITVLTEAYAFYEGYDPDMTWWVERPFKQLVDDMEAYVMFLKGNFSTENHNDDGSGIIGRPIGREAIISGLRQEFIPYTPEELIEIAEREFAWSEAEMKKASAALGYGEDWKQALEAVKESYFPIGEWPQEINRLAEEAVEFIESRDLISIPALAKETWRMRMLTPEEQKFAPFFLGGESILVAYPTTSMSHEEKMMSLRGNNPHFSRAVVHHELIPGHHLQQFMNQRYKPYRSLFRTPFWTEGWALYWEMNLWDKNFPRSAEDKIGMLFWRMHRSARIIFSLNYHLGTMSPQECIDFLVERVGHERANAEGEVRRSFTGNYGPLYQIAYMVGGLQFVSLKNEMVGGGLMTEKDFHDRIMKENSIPIALLREILRGGDPNKTISAWRFYEY
ncbi:DUF885 family protein [Anditalea andensis]|uniref:X-Pro dipeptidyl-peptidase n=1 Tax=Anditalea andensis TaxID=1048983 RepID=A0A074LNP8_9BACT|nr:DUF885 family protein [Anditalea andensis]KEO75542.1 X-Pro dipeptidyl-peptidase [Anditalea andensis]